MKDIIRLGLVLMIIAAVAAGALAKVNGITLPLIEDNAAKTEQAAYMEVLPAGKQFEEKTSEIENLHKYPDVRKVTLAKDENGNFVGAIITVAPYGYSSNIVTLVGIGTDGKITAIKVISQNETPGLGTAAQEPWFQDQFKGLSKENDIRVNKDGGEIQSITASTITSRAVTSGVKQAVDLFNELNLAE